ncbi:MAG TPA: rhomboid family intramembrane serine protease [Acidobacteriota bacterium]|nr:rhomboid family intramembrane serine protease [Acidobacteriota bacterium]
MNYRDQGFGFDPGFRMRQSSVVKTIIIINVAVYLLELVLKATGRFDLFIGLFALVPELVTRNLFIWQFVTALFVHADFFHILFNMLGLFFFGPEIEAMWGSRRFALVYLIIGALANVFSYVLNIHSMAPILGASGAVLGILTAYATIFPNRRIIFILFPVKAKWLILIYFAISFLGLTGLEGGGGGGTAYAAHFAGIVLGFAYVKLRWRSVSTLFGEVTHKARIAYLKWKYRNLKILDNDREETRWDEWKN